MKWLKDYFVWNKGKCIAYFRLYWFVFVFLSRMHAGILTCASVCVCVCPLTASSGAWCCALESCSFSDLSRFCWALLRRHVPDHRRGSAPCVPDGLSSSWQPTTAVTRPAPGHRLPALATRAQPQPLPRIDAGTGARQKPPQDTHTRCTLQLRRLFIYSSRDETRSDSDWLYDFSHCKILIYKQFNYAGLLMHCVPWQL